MFSMRLVRLHCSIFLWLGSIPAVLLIKRIAATVIKEVDVKVFGVLLYKKADRLNPGVSDKS